MIGINKIIAAVIAFIILIVIIWFRKGNPYEKKLWRAPPAFLEESELELFTLYIESGFVYIIMLANNDHILNDAYPAVIEKCGDGWSYDFKGQDVIPPGMMHINADSTLSLSGGDKVYGLFVED